MKGLAIRRHHLQRVKRNRRKEDERHWSFGSPKTEPAPAVPARRVGIRAHTACCCSCWMCRNPRWHEGDPINDRRRIDAAEYAA